MRNILGQGSSQGACCSLCGSAEKLHKHHSDYAKPLLVDVVCAKCHYKITKNEVFTDV
jgi:hypothetical protein